MNCWLTSFIHLIFPHCCIICNAPLHSHSEKICIRCNINLPRTNYHRMADNPVEKLIWGKVEIEKASSFLFYRKGSDLIHILHRLKYRDRPEIGVLMGKQMAAELSESDFFNGIDTIIPVPLHKIKYKKRGYNQSEEIASGISAITNIPVETRAIIRIKNSETQTHKSVFDRWENVADVFYVKNPDLLSHKHILLIDDVLTTGSTIVACAGVMQQIPGIKISILTLAVAQ